MNHKTEARQLCGGISKNLVRSENPLIWSSKFVYEVEFSSVIRGHHVYKLTWSPTLGESMACKEDECKEAKEHDEFAVGTYLQASDLLGMYRWNFPSLKPTETTKSKSR